MGVVPLRGQVPSVLRVLHSGCHTRVRAVCYTLADPKAHGLRKAQVWEHRCHKCCVFFKLLKTEVLYCSGRDTAWDFWSLRAVLALTPSFLQTACGSSLYSPVLQVGTRGRGVGDLPEITQLQVVELIWTQEGQFQNLCWWDHDVVLALMCNPLRT